MEKLVLSIAEIPIAIYLEYPLEPLAPPLSKLFHGYISKGDKSDYSLTLSYDHVKTYSALEKHPISINENVYPELINRIKEIYPLSNDSIAVGFQNGCLSYNRLSCKGHLLFLRTRKSHFIMGTLYKLLFIFISLIMAEKKKFIMHGAGIEGNEGGYLFLGESGAGKTTVAGFADKRQVLSDDAPIIGYETDLFYMYPSPFGQINLFAMKDEAHHEKKVQLNNLFFLKKNEVQSIILKERRYAFAEILKKHIHGIEFMDKDSRGAAFNFFHDLCECIPMYDLNFQKNNQFWTDISKIEINPESATPSCHFD